MFCKFEKLDFWHPSFICQKKYVLFNFPWFDSLINQVTIAALLYTSSSFPCSNRWP